MHGIRVQRGFTLIELVMVIVLIGVLSAMALPKFVDLSTNAKQAAVDGVAGALSSASAINFAARTADASKGQAVTNCNSVDDLLQGGLPTNYSITSSSIAAGSVNSACMVVYAPATGASASANFTANGIN